MVSRTIYLAAVLPALALAACQGPPSTRMLALPTPDHWQHDVSRFRQDRDAFFRSDPNTPLLPEDRGEFAGLDYFDPDPDYYRVGPVRWYSEPEQFTMVTTSGKRRPCQRAGFVEFELQGHSLTLQVYRLLDSDPQAGDGFFLPFMDETTGSETYPAGRYLDLAGPPGGPFVLDFNRAYNPSCAYGSPERFACPVTPAEHRLPLPIHAGERGFKRGAENAG